MSIHGWIRSVESIPRVLMLLRKTFYRLLFCGDLFKRNLNSWDSWPRWSLSSKFFDDTRVLSNEVVEMTSISAQKTTMIKTSTKNIYLWIVDGQDVNLNSKKGSWPVIFNIECSCYRKIYSMRRICYILFLDSVVYNTRAAWSKVYASMRTSQRICPVASGYCLM